MSNTLRRRPWGMNWQQPDRWAKRHSDKTCKTGCAVCGKDREHRKLEKTRTRRIGKEEIKSQVLGTPPPPTRTNGW